MRLIGSTDIAVAFRTARDTHRVVSIAPRQNEALNNEAISNDHAMFRTAKNPAEAGFSIAPRAFGSRSALESSGLEGLDSSGQTALVTSGFVLVNQTARAEAIKDRLSDRESGLSASGVVGVECLQHFLDGGAQHGTLSGVTGIAHDGLLGAFLGGLDVGHDGILRCCEFDRRSMKAKALERVRIPLGDEKRREQTAAMRAVRPKIMGDSGVCVNWCEAPKRIGGPS
jgi:hypothetical protein